MAEMAIKIALSLLGLAALVLLLFFGLGLYSHLKEPETGIIDGKLRPCPDSPNCVCSESLPGNRDGQKIDPIRAEGGDIDKLWQVLKVAVVDSGGEVVEERSDYLHAEFTSPLFRFVDDFELFLDRSRREIHIRSASRVGYSDMGANRKRVTKIWNQLGRPE